MEKIKIAHMLSDTVAAIATPPGQSGIAVVRVTGPAVPYLGDLLFEPISSRFVSFSQMEPYTCAPGYWLKNMTKQADASSSALIPPVKERRIDQVVITCFRAPHSFTGEDVLEISCHGSVAVKQEILASLLAAGAVAAGPGEFTKRAFLNGKLDLAQAEAVMDLIQAEARLQAETAIRQLQGSVSDAVAKADQQIYALLAQTELILEFPEHEETPENLHTLQKQIGQVKESLHLLTDTYRQGKLLSEGLNVVIAGRPNAGKSSLLNQLAGYERAIVTEIAGTTRDTIRETVDLAGLPIHLTDTAGIRNSDDPIEKMGVERAHEAIKQADVVVWLVSPPLEEISAEIEEVKRALADGKAVIIVCGKEDLEDSLLVKERLEHDFPHKQIIPFSAVTGEGLDSVRASIRELYDDIGAAGSEAVLLTNRRHLEAALTAIDRLAEADAALGQGLTLDLVAMLLRAAAESLAEITGQSVSEEIVQTIFSRFCVGK